VPRRDESRRADKCKGFHNLLFVFLGVAKSFLLRLCKKVFPIPPPSAAKESFEWTSFFLISLRKIRKKDVHSKYNLAAQAAKE